MAITFNAQGVENPFIPKAKIKILIKKILNDFHKFEAKIAIVFVNNEQILEMNNKYLKHDYYTDIITFNYNEFNIVSGDLFISVDTVKENAITYNTNYKQEILRVILHGILHLVGIEDKTEEDKKEMRNFEDYYISAFSKL